MDSGSTVCKLPYKVDLAAVPFISTSLMAGHMPPSELFIPRKLL